MKITERLKSLFNRNELADAINNLPTRNTITSEDLIQKLDKYKNEYLTGLKEKNDFIDTIGDRLKALIIMYAFLTLEVCFNHEKVENSLLACSSDIDKIKFKTYQDNFKQVKEEIDLRLVALNEISNENNYLEKTDDPIYDLLDILNMFIKTNNHLNKQLDKNRLLKKEYYNEENFKKRINIVNILSNEIFEGKVIFDVDTCEEVALMEVDLEEYAYLNINRALDYKQQLDELINSSNYDENKIKEIEKKLILFYLYGKDAVTKEDLKKLYIYKLKQLIMSDDLFEGSLITEESLPIEVECYKEIIEGLIKDVLEGNYPLGYFPHINLIDNFFKSGKKYFDYNEIINDNVKLNLLFAIVSKSVEKQEKYFYKYKIDKNYFSNINYFDKILTWEDKISIPALNWIMSMGSNKNYKEPLCMLYEKFDMIRSWYGHRTSDDEFIVPDGVLTIKADPNDGSNMPSYYKKSKDFYDVYNTLFSVDKTEYIFPDSVESINIKSNAIIKKLVLPKNLKYLSLNINNLRISSLEIPQDLEEIDNLLLGNSLNSITFLDYKNNKILTNLEEFSKLIRPYVHVDVKRKMHFASEENKRKQKLYDEGRYSAFLDSGLYDHDHWYNALTATCGLLKIGLIDEQGREEQINLSEFKYEDACDDTDYFGRKKSKEYIEAHTKAAIEKFIKQLFNHINEQINLAKEDTVLKRIKD